MVAYEEFLQTQNLTGTFQFQEPIKYPFLVNMNLHLNYRKLQSVLISLPSK